MSKFTNVSSIATVLLIIGIFVLLMRIKTSEDISNQTVEELAIPGPQMTTPNPEQGFSQSAARQHKLNLDTPVQKI